MSFGIHSNLANTAVTGGDVHPQTLPTRAEITSPLDWVGRVRATPAAG